MIEAVSCLIFAAMAACEANAVWLDEAIGRGPINPGGRATMESLDARMDGKAVEAEDDNDEFGPAQMGGACTDAPALRFAVIADDAALELFNGLGSANWCGPSMLVDRTVLGSNASNCRDSKLMTSRKNLQR